MGLNAGAAYLFNGDPSSDAFGALLQTFSAPGSDVGFGRSVTGIGENVLVASSTIPDSPNTGAAYLFDGDPSSPTFGALLQTFVSPSPASSDDFGHSVSGAGRNVVIGARADDTGARDAGVVYLFDGDPSSSNFGTLLRTFLNPNPDDLDQFGYAVAGVGEQVLVGTLQGNTGAVDAGVAYLFGLQLEGPLDIKPGSCPNPLNVKRKGQLSVAILGTSEFDVTQVDPLSLSLVGVAPLKSKLRDVATPFQPFIGKEQKDDCTNERADGFADLVMEFSSQAIVAELGNVSNHEVIVLKLSGNLKAEFGGKPLAGEDVVVILKRS